MPIDYKEYPSNWKYLSRQIIITAGNRCELCYAPNGEMIVRDPDSAYPWQLAENIDGREYPKLTKVVLTVHHIDGDKKNSSKHNLICLCQRCHCRIDLPKHIKNSKKTRANKKNTLQYSLPLSVLW